MSIVSGSLAAYSQGEAAGEANQTNIMLARAQARQNWKMFLAARKNLTPEYFRRGERMLASGARQGLRTLTNQYGGINDQYQRLRGFRNEYRPIQEGADRTAAGIFDNSLTNEALGYLQPVTQARLAQAEAGAQASEQALAQQLAVQNASAAQKGFVGDTTGEGMMAYEARRQAATDAALARTGAGLANAQDTYLINQSGINQKVANMGLPGQMIAARMANENAPESELVRQLAGRASIMSPFMIGGGAPPYAQPSTVQPVPGLGQIAGQALSQAGNTLGNYYLYKNLYANNAAPNYGQFNFQPSGGGYHPVGGGSPSYGAGSPAAAGDWASSMAASG